MMFSLASGLLPLGLVAAFACHALGAAFGGAAVVVARSRVASSVAEVYLGQETFMVRDYIDVLRIAIVEASLWYGKKKSGEPSKPTRDLDVAALEALLLKEVDYSGRHLDHMIEEINKSKTKKISLKSTAFEGTSLESQENMLKRMQIMVKTVDMYNKEVGHMQFVGIVGAEDAGQSTFILDAIKNFGEKCDSEDLPKVGFMSCTKSVRPYKLRDSLYLVDFPGSNGTKKYAEAWKLFKSLPSFCILLLDFKDDIKQDQIDMYKGMKKDLDSKNVTVVFNKVDEKFTPRREDKMDAEYFTGQRAKVVCKLNGCKSEDVHFVCLDHDITEDKFMKLRKAGVLEFKELANKVLGLKPKTVSKQNTFKD